MLLLQRSSFTFTSALLLYVVFICSTSFLLVFVWYILLYPSTLSLSESVLLGLWTSCHYNFCGPLATKKILFSKNYLLYLVITNVFILIHLPLLLYDRIKGNTCHGDMSTNRKGFFFFFHLLFKTSIQIIQNSTNCFL